MNPRSEKQVLIGISLATLASLIWSGNFIVARAAYKLLPPISMAFFRWLTATLIIVPLGFRSLMAERAILIENKKYLFYCSLSGITLFNSCIYIAGHYTTAINLALVGTSSSPIMAVVLASIFLNERVTPLRILGLSLCVFGILYLMGKGDLGHILLLKFSLGDLWVLLGAFFFAIYNVLARKKPSGISPLTFLTVIFSLGTLMLFPFFILEQQHSPAIQWNLHLFWIVLYLGLGNSVISYLCWNAAIARLGASRTALFGNLIPIFASIEAAYLLNESITIVHVISLVLVIIGLIIANIRNRKP